MADIILWNCIFWSVWLTISYIPYLLVQNAIDNNQVSIVDLSYLYNTSALNINDFYHLSAPKMYFQILINDNNGKST